MPPLEKATRTLVQGVLSGDNPLQPAQCCCNIEHLSYTPQLPTKQNHDIPRLYSIQLHMNKPDKWFHSLKYVHSYSECGTHCTVHNCNIPPFGFEGNFKYQCVSKTTCQSRVQIVKSSIWSVIHSARPFREKPHVGKASKTCPPSPFLVSKHKGQNHKHNSQF